MLYNCHILERCGLGGCQKTCCIARETGMESLTYRASRACQALELPSSQTARLLLPGCRLKVVASRIRDDIALHYPCWYSQRQPASRPFPPPHLTRCPIAGCRNRSRRIDWLFGLHGGATMVLIDCLAVVTGRHLGRSKVPIACPAPD